MPFNDRFKNKQKKETSPVEDLQKSMDGFVLVGYTKGEHKKVVHFHANDPACRDALNFFNVAIEVWLEMGQDSPTEEES